MNGNRGRAASGGTAMLQRRGPAALPEGTPILVALEQRHEKVLQELDLSGVPGVTSPRRGRPEGARLNAEPCERRRTPERSGWLWLEASRNSLWCKDSTVQELPRPKPADPSGFHELPRACPVSLPSV